MVTERAPIQIDKKLLKKLKLFAVKNNTSVKKVAEEAIKEYLTVK
jgi:hypothetical protein